MEPICLVKNEKGATAGMVLTLLAVIVIVAVLAMKSMHIASTPLPASPPAVVRMKIPPIPEAEPQKAHSAQLPPEAEGRTGTASDQPGEDSMPAEPNGDEAAALSSPLDTSSDTGIVSARSPVADGADIEPPPAKPNDANAPANALVRDNSNVVPEQEPSADRGESGQMARVEENKDVPPRAASDPADDLEGTATTSEAVAESTEKPVGRDSPETTDSATASKNEALYTVQVGAFHNKAYADAQLVDLKKLGYPAFIVEVMDKNQRPLYLVSFGRYKTLSEAVDIAAVFKAKVNMEAVVIRL